MREPEYLGDDVYVTEDALGNVVLTTGSHLRSHQQIVLEPQVLAALDRWRGLKFAQPAEGISVHPSIASVRREARERFEAWIAGHDAPPSLEEAFLAGASGETHLEPTPPDQAARRAEWNEVIEKGEADLPARHVRVLLTMQYAKLEEMAAAFLKETGLPPLECELCTQQVGGETRMWFRKRGG